MPHAHTSSIAIAIAAVLPRKIKERVCSVQIRHICIYVTVKFYTSAIHIIKSESYR